MKSLQRRKMEEKKVSPNRQKKEQIVAKLSHKVNRAKGFVFTNYQGLTHVQLEKLKKAIKQANAELVVTKNTLLKLALEKVSLEKVSKDGKVSNVPKGERSPFDTFTNPTATLFLYADPIEPLKQLAKTIKELSLPTVKFGILEGQSLTGEQVLKLATLPTRNVLIAQLLFQMKAPLYRLHRVLGWNIQRLVMTLKAIETKKS